jgi:hypothetical protein
MAKQRITEATGLACAVTAATIALQYLQGGINNVSSEAVSIFITAAVPLVLRITGKQRERKESSKGII